ncbi:PAS domain S-box protein [Oscillatoria sp. FACHB-1407]|uniref:PAS domain S-box protein n=1 Tax=Oscillatoria sp. FACHB-1407 TaxID=2692847 RepID=UPI0016820C7D|nr:PAS domain S-box protein [Oscillatoria sp. FACHB-1407]
MEQDNQGHPYDETNSNSSELGWQQVNGLLRVLSSCNRAIVRAVDELALLQEICRMIVEIGGYRAAWISFAESNEATHIRPVAQAGEMGQSLQEISIHWAEDELGQRLTRTTICTGEIAIAQNLVNHPTHSHWREAALQGGCAAVIALPLTAEAPILGALSICSTRSDAFAPAETELLNELATDLAYGIAALRTRLEQQQVELALRASEERFRAFLEMASEAVIVSNARGEIVIFNTKAEDLFGYSADEVLGRSIESLMPERFRQGHLVFRAEYNRQPSQRSMGHARNLYALRKDGTEFPIEAGLSSVQIEDERFVLTFLTDISDRKRAEAQLRESREHLRYIIELNPQVPWTADPHGKITDFNERWLTLTGLTREQAMGEGWSQVPHPDDLPAMLAAWTYSITTGNPYDIQHRIKLADGSYRWMRSRAFPRRDEHKQILGWYGTTEDIHDTKCAEEQLRESEQRFRDMADCAPVMIWVTDVTGACTFLSQSWYDFTGQTETTGLGLGWLEAVHPDDQKFSGDIFVQANARQEQFRIEYRLRRKDGTYRWAINAATPWFGADGQFKGYIGSVFDITDRKQAEQALQESEARLKLAYKATRSGVWDWDVIHNSSHISEEYCLLFGLDPTQQTIRYEQWLSLLHPDDRASASETVNRVIQQKQSYYADEYRVLLPDGIRWLSARGQVFYDAAGNPVRMLGNMQDITERKQAEIALSQLNEDLEQRVRDRTLELSQLNDRLQQELQERKQTQKQLAEQAQLLDLAHDPIITRDSNGIITFWSRGAEQMYGWTRAEALGQSIHTLLKTQFPCPISDIDAALLRSRYWEGELIHQRRDGTPMTVASRWVLQRDDNGNPIKVLEINNDITSSKQVEQVQARLAAIIESSDDAIISTTLEGIIDSWNWGAEKLYGYSAVEVIGQPATLLLPYDRQHEETQIIERLQRGDRIEHYETVRQHKDGRLIDVSLTASPLKNAAGDIIGVSKIARDITRRKQAEMQVQLSNERISLANAELARASRLKDEFLAGMSHELRTPLNAILGLSEALLEEIFGELTAEQREHISTIEQSGKHLLELINDILDLSKVESGKMELEISPVVVQDLCDSSLSFIKQQAHHKRIKISCRIDPELVEVELDERRIRQVLVNLLSNAVKFTPDNGRVELQVRADLFRETIDFIVTDTGIGIASENINKLFQPFVQLDSSLSRRYAGTGLGLVLVRRIAELHGGSVTLESQIDKGSRFTVTLPWHPPTAIAESVSTTTPATTHSSNLQQALIIEDSQAAASQIARYLTEMGATTLVHPIGGGATQVAIGLRPDIIILDVLLPDRSGWEVLADLKANPETQAIPVIVVSVVDERPYALALGASAYLLKPISRPQLQKTINQILGQVEQDDQQSDLQPPDFMVTESQRTTTPLILLAEDSEANIVTLSSYLQAHNFQIVLARNGLEAIQMAQQHKPNLILMDIQMPEMDGLEAAQRIHSNQELQHIPIIALTALAMPGDRERCLSAGAVDYLTKPISLKHLLNLLSTYIPQVNFN